MSTLFDQLEAMIQKKKMDFVLHDKTFGIVAVRLDFEDFDYQDPITISKIDGTQPISMDITHLPGEPAYHIIIGINMMGRKCKQLNHLLCIQAYCRLQMMHYFGMDEPPVVLVDCASKIWLTHIENRLVSIERLEEEFISSHFPFYMRSNIVLEDLVHNYFYRRNKDAEEVLAKASDIKIKMMFANSYDRELVKLFAFIASAYEIKPIVTYRPIGSVINTSY